MEPMITPERSPEVSPEREVSPECSPDDVASEASGSVSTDDLHTRMGDSARDSTSHESTMRDSLAWSGATLGVETQDSTILAIKSLLEGMETRLQDIEVRVDRTVKTNTVPKRFLENSGIVGLMGGLLTALLIFTLTTLNSRIDELDQTIQALDASVDARFEKFEEKIDTRFEKVDERMDNLQTTLETLVAVLEVQGKIPTGVVE